MSKTRTELEQRLDELETGLEEIADALDVESPDIDTARDVIARLLGDEEEV